MALFPLVGQVSSLPLLTAPQNRGKVMGSCTFHKQAGRAYSLSIPFSELSQKTMGRVWVNKILLFHPLFSKRDNIAAI
ncbi:hypothetical protein RvY_17233 [Ramazzottius varieornatus]|uniref:Uncharacterized protein n=1 Tax=Ramazzottius varieornatus TaxID=947166 RepID=A0A1D1W1E7_RAMVA|nr:hypothetical protein RvY_17233 [Ramazzottius varieornatus]